MNHHEPSWHHEATWHHETSWHHEASWKHHENIMKHHGIMKHHDPHWRLRISGAANAEVPFDITYEDPASGTSSDLGYLLFFFAVSVVAIGRDVFSKSDSKSLKDATGSRNVPQNPKIGKGGLRQTSRMDSRIKTFNHLLISLPSMHPHCGESLQFQPETWHCPKIGPKIIRLDEETLYGGS